MSSNARRTVLFPEPESPVRMTSWRVSGLVSGFTGGGGSVFFPGLVGAGNSHILAVFRDRAPRDVNTGVIKLFGNLFVRQRLGRIFFLDHLLAQPLER